jgi:hypothetical protein
MPHCRPSDNHQWQAIRNRWDTFLAYQLHLNFLKYFTVSCAA